VSGQYSQAMQACNCTVLRLKGVLRFVNKDYIHILQNM